MAAAQLDLMYLTADDDYNFPKTPGTNTLVLGGDEDPKGPTNEENPTNEETPTNEENPLSEFLTLSSKKRVATEVHTGTKRPRTRTSKKPAASAVQPAPSSTRPAPSSTRFVLAQTAPAEEPEEDEEALLRSITGIGSRQAKTLVLSDQYGDQSQYYTTAADPNVALNKEFSKFKARIKKNLFRMQPIKSLRNEPEPLIQELFTIIISFKSEKKLKNLDRILQTIQYPPISTEDLKKKNILGDVLRTFVGYQETGSASCDVLLPLFVDCLFGEDIRLRLPAVGLTYFLLNESLPIEHTVALLRLLAVLADLPPAFIEMLDKGFQFSEVAIDAIEKLV